MLSFILSKGTFYRSVSLAARAPKLSQTFGRSVFVILSVNPLKQSFLKDDSRPLTSSEIFHVFSCFVDEMSDIFGISCTGHNYSLPAWVVGFRFVFLSIATCFSFKLKRLIQLTTFLSKFLFSPIPSSWSTCIDETEAAFYNLEAPTFLCIVPSYSLWPP